MITGRSEIPQLPVGGDLRCLGGPGGRGAQSVFLGILILTHVA